MHYAIGHNRVDFILEGVEKGRRLRSFDQAGYSVGLAHVLGVADQAHQRILRGWVVADRVLRTDCGSVRAELCLDRQPVLLGGQSSWKAAIDKSPALVAI